MEHAIRLERTIHANPAKIWNALTDPALMRQWYFPMMQDFKAEPGFETQFSVTHEGREFIHIWKITEAVEPQKLSYLWKYDGYPGASLLQFRLTGLGDKTLLELTHSQLLSFEPEINPELSSGNFLEGWNAFLNALDQFVSRR